MEFLSVSGLVVASNIVMLPETGINTNLNIRLLLLCGWIAISGSCLVFLYAAT